MVIHISNIFVLLSLGNKDYNFTTHNIVLTAEKTSMPFYIQIINDDELEDPEDFILTVDKSKSILRSRVSVIRADIRNQTGDQTKVVIMDDNGE